MAMVHVEDNDDAELCLVPRLSEKNDERANQRARWVRAPGNGRSQVKESQKMSIEKYPIDNPILQHYTSNSYFLELHKAQPWRCHSWDIVTEQSAGIGGSNYCQSRHGSGVWETGKRGVSYLSKA